MSKLITQNVYNFRMTMKEIEEVFGIPYRTLQEFKTKDNSNWRKILFEYLKVQDIEKIKHLQELGIIPKFEKKMNNG